MRVALTSALLRHDLDVVAACDRLTTALRVQTAERPHVLLLADGLTPLSRRLLPEVREFAGDLSVVVMTGMHPDVAALLHGGLLDAVLGPQVGVDRLCRAVHRARAGERFAAGHETSRALHRQPRVELTDREQDVLHLLAAGASNDAIAARLGISVNTVRTHVQGLLRKLGAGRRVAAVRRATELGLIERTSA